MSQPPSTPPQPHYKLIARAPLQRHEILSFHNLLTQLRGPMVQALHSLHTHNLTSPTKNTSTLLSSTNLSPEDDALLSAKQRIQSSHLILRQKWKNSGYDSEYTDDGVKEYDKVWPKSLVSGDMRVVPLWTRVFFGMTDDGMRMTRNYFAHRFGVSRDFAVEEEEGEELEQMRWVGEMYEGLVPAVEVLVEKLEAAMGDEGNWMVGKPRGGEREGDLPEYSRDLDEVEASWEECLEPRRGVGEDIDEDVGNWEGEEEDVVINVDDDIQITESPSTEVVSEETVSKPRTLSFSAINYILNTLFRLRFARRFAATTVDALQNQLLTMQGYQGRQNWIEHGRDIYQSEADEDVEAQWGDTEEEEIEQESIEPFVQTEWVDNAPW